MTLWKNVPGELYDLYIEVGALKAVEETADCCFVEVWVGSCFSGKSAREECTGIARRPVFKVMKEIVQLAGEKKVCPVFMSDDKDTWADAIGWGFGIYLMLKELEKAEKLGGAVLFTGKTYDAVLNSPPPTHRRTRAGELYEVQCLLDMTDVLVTGRPNRFVPGETPEVRESCSAAAKIPKWRILLPESPARQA